MAPRSNHGNHFRQAAHPRSVSLDSKFKIKFRPNSATISKATRLKQSCRFGNIPLPDLGRRSSQRRRSVLIVLIARTDANQQYDYDECIRTSQRSEGNRCRRHGCCWWIFSFLPGAGCRLLDTFVPLLRVFVNCAFLLVLLVPPAFLHWVFFMELLIFLRALNVKVVIII